MTQFNLEAPGGQVHIKAHCKDGCIDLHCGGEPARVMFSTSCPPIPGKSMAQKRESMIKNFDQIRKVLLQVKFVV